MIWIIACRGLRKLWRGPQHFRILQDYKFCAGGYYPNYLRVDALESLVSSKLQTHPVTFLTVQTHQSSAQFFVLYTPISWPLVAPFSHHQLSLLSAQYDCSARLTATSACLCSCILVYHRCFPLARHFFVAQ